MMESRRLLALAAALNLTVCVSAVSAQTVIVRNAPPDSLVEVVLNDTAVGSSKTNDKGDALVAVGMSERLMKAETDAQIFVDICPAVRRVLVVERSVQVPLQEAGCTRRDMGGIFVVKSISSLVVDVGGPSPTLLLRQGRVSLDPPRVWKPAPTGLVLFGGGAFTSGGNVTAIACGDVAGCSGDQAGLGYSAGAAYWLTPFLAAEGTYIKAADATAAGRTDTFEFESVFEVEVLTLVGKVGIPRGPVRPYGLAGATYQQSTFRTSQTMLGAGDTEHPELSDPHRWLGLCFRRRRRDVVLVRVRRLRRVRQCRHQGHLARPRRRVRIGRRSDALRALWRQASRRGLVARLSAFALPPPPFRLRLSASAFGLRRTSRASARQALLHVEQFDFEDERRVRRNGAVPDRAVGERRGDDEAAHARRPSCPEVPGPSPQSPDPTRV